MKRLLLLLALVVNAFACPSLIDRCDLYLNKPGVRLEPLPSHWLEKMRQEFEVEEIAVDLRNGIVHIGLRVAPGTRGEVSMGFHETVGQKAVSLLKKVYEKGYLKGLNEIDIKTIKKLAGGGKVVYYLPPVCDKDVLKPQSLHSGTMKKGWYATSNGNRLRFDADACPHIEVLR